MDIFSEIKVPLNLTQALRLDAYLAQKIGPEFNLSRSVIQKMIKDSWVCVNNKIESDPAFKIRGGETIALRPPQRGPQPSALKLPILYEDAHFVAVNKPSGLMTHPKSSLAFSLKKDWAASLGVLKESSVLNWILEVYPQCRDIPRYGIAHRLDAGASGVLLIAKTRGSYEAAVKLFAQREMQKTYRCLVWGQPKDREGVISKPLLKKYASRVKVLAHPSGKEALTSYKVLKNYGAISLLEVYPKTGRTHQIRVHLSSIGHPICGDPIYKEGIRVLGYKGISEKDDKETRPSFSRLMLHAWKLEFKHPIAKKQLVITAPLPENFV